jgi:hypothetical protein
MRALKVLAMVAAIIGGCLSVSGAPASAEPLNVGSPIAAAAQNVQVDWAHYRRYYHRHYRPYYRPRRVHYRRAYYRPVRYIHRPRVVCRWRATAFGMRRVCYR